VGAELYYYVVILPGHLQTMRNALLVKLDSSKTILGMAVMPWDCMLPLIALDHSTTCSVDKSEGKTSL
jgi:hypothetical protein